MANVSITGTCNRACSYCFARATLASGPQLMSEATFASALGHVRAWGSTEVRLLGGEPTLHPQFGAFVDAALAAGLRVVVFSNGLMPPGALEALCAADAERLIVIVNASTLREGSESERIAATTTLRRLGSRAMLGVNLHAGATAGSELLDLISELGLRPGLRLGLAHPTLHGDDHGLPPTQYRAMGRVVSTLARVAAARGVELALDCGFVPCMFEDEELPALDVAVRDCGMRCNPLLDILPDGRAIACYPLADLGSVELKLGKTEGELRAHFEALVAPVADQGIFPECASCRHLLEQRCRGGCRAATMRRLRAIRSAYGQTSTAACEPKTAARAVGRQGALWTIPYVDQPLELWQALKQEFGAAVKEVYFPISAIGSGRPPQADAHLIEFLRWGGLPGAALLNLVVLGRPVRAVAPAVLDELRELHERYGIRAATVANLELARRIRAALPEIELAASVLMDVASPLQAAMLGDTFDVLVPSGRVFRDQAALRALRASFAGRIRLMVNEGCLPGCPFRIQHFFEMRAGVEHPPSLCEELLARSPWLRLTGAWVLPQRLHLYDGLYDELKLDGRATLHDAERYRDVLRAYCHRTPLPPNAIGGGPASVLAAMDIDEDFVRAMLTCISDDGRRSRAVEYHRMHSRMACPGPAVCPSDGGQFGRQ